MTAHLASLLDEVEVLETRGDVPATEVTGVTQDSQAVAPGALYCCIRGRRVDGHDLAERVVAAGAGSLLVERIVGVQVPQVRVGSTREAVAAVAAAFYGHPSRHLSVVGVTGTNGKTTTTHLLGAIARAAAWPAAVLGTLSGERTTPEAPVLQGTLAALRDQGTVLAAMEVSSIALDQHRVDAVTFAVAVWTNLTQDHLDYHGTMERYFSSKATLFEPGRTRAAVINADDPWARRLGDQLSVPTVRYQMADAEDLDVGLTASTFRWRGQMVRLRPGGRHNVANALAAATTAELLGINAEHVAAGLSSLAVVPGRFERVDAGQPFEVIVDYAHTPDGLEQALRSARAATPGRVVVVFGCGGDRDRTKRPLMGAMATQLADRVVITSDNPRGEDPDAIIAEVLAGAVRPDVVIVEPDRAAAISVALAGAKAGDTVLVAGKGHETGQVIGSNVMAFDDRDVARTILAGLGHTKAPPA